MVTDHVPVVSSVRLRFRKMIPKTRPHCRQNVELLVNSKRHKTKFKKLFQEGLSRSQFTSRQAEENYSIFCKTLTQAANAVLPKEREVAKQHWMTEEILQKMDARREAKGNVRLHKKLDKEIRKQCWKAKQIYSNSQCRTIEELDKKHHTRALHAEIRKAAGIRKKETASGCVENRYGEIIVEKNEKLDCWKEFVEKQFNDNQGARSIRRRNEHLLTITPDEVRATVKKSASGKAAGPDGNVCEMISAAGEGGVTALTQLMNQIYAEGKVPEEMAKYHCQRSLVHGNARIIV